MKRALILNAISNAIGGVLIRGERGTAKSTAARALADLLPEIAVVADCPFACDPSGIDTLCDNCRDRLARGEALPVAQRRTRFVDLPVSATEDRVVGTLDIEKAIQHGEKGTFGATPMPANPTVSDDDAKLIAGWISSLKK